MLSLLNAKTIMIIGLAGSLAFSAWAWGEIRYQKSESNRKGDNYESLRDMDSLKVAHLTFRTNQEIEDYLESNDQLQELLDKQDVKIRRLTNIIYQKQEYIDNNIRSTDVTGLVDDIRNNIESTSKFTDSTECLIVRGDVIYKNDSLTVNVTNREFNNEIAITGAWERQKWSFLGLFDLSLFGRKRATATATSKCGESETIIINRKK